jgi:hypothetical protein
MMALVIGAIPRQMGQGDRQVLADLSKEFGLSSSSMHSPVTPELDIYWCDTRADSSFKGGAFMTPWVHRVSYPSTVLQYLGDLFLTLLIAISGIALLMFGLLLFT